LTPPETMVVDCGGKRRRGLENVKVLRRRSEPVRASDTPIDSDRVGRKKKK
jgi:hypothetical protein